MIVTLWGTRGSLPCSGPDMTQYGGNTSCLEVRDGSSDTLLILDAGTGIRRLGYELGSHIKRIDILLTHLHMDHIQGLGFFTPLFDPTMEVHIYGPATSNRHLHSLLTKYLSPPLFPVLLNDLPCRLYLHKIPEVEFKIGDFQISAQTICHPGLTVGYRISSKTSTLAYLPDHEPALGTTVFPLAPEWTSGYALAKDADLLVHDAQYTQREYQERVGWGHSSIEQAIAFATLAKAKIFVPFHHDPSHNDKILNMLSSYASSLAQDPLQVLPGIEGNIFKLGLPVSKG